MKISELPESFKRILRPFYYFIPTVKVWAAGVLNPSKIKDAKQIPVIINNFNRLDCLKGLIYALEERGYFNLYIIDNKSSYPPLLEWYDTCKYKVFRLTENLGFRALWKSGIYRQFYRDYYVYTDSDVIPIEECPADFMAVFFEQMQKDRQVFKIGLGLKIDDLPDFYNKKKEVIAHEKKFHTVHYSQQFYVANVDTTFALYRSGFSQSANGYFKMLRSKYPYEVRHIPWYSNSQNLSEEEQYYIEHTVKPTHWTSLNK